MRQTFTFAESNHKPPQALAALKNQVRKYVKRERRKSLPEGVDYWDFDCKVGDDEESATEAHISEVTNRMQAVFDSGNATVYVEILAKPGVRKSTAMAAKRNAAASPVKSQAMPRKHFGEKPVPKGSSPSPTKSFSKTPLKSAPKSNKPAAKSRRSDDDDITPSSDWSFG